VNRSARRSAEQVVASARDWVWIPVDARRHTTAELDIVAYPDHFGMPTQVLRSAADGPLEELLERARHVARGWGRPTLFWWVSGDSTPDLAVPAEVTVRRVDDEPSVRASEVVAATAFGSGPTPEERLPSILAETLSAWQDRTGFRSLAYRRAVPAATGGCTMAGPVARLWGAGALPAHRGKGAYRAVLDHRLRVARELGATLALVKGRVATSGPILRRAGFTSYGVEHCYRLPV